MLMSIPPETIQVGQCYLTNSGQVRRVIAVMADGRVRYERRPGDTPDAPWQEAMQELAIFAALAEGEVPCDLGPAPEFLGIG